MSYIEQEKGWNIMGLLCEECRAGDKMGYYGIVV